MYEPQRELLPRGSGGAAHNLPLDGEGLSWCRHWGGDPGKLAAWLSRVVVDVWTDEGLGAYHGCRLPTTCHNTNKPKHAAKSRA